MTEYSGLVGLTQSVLAINMAYLALERFRYRAKIHELASDARGLIEEVPDSVKLDLAYRRIIFLASGEEKDCWAQAISGYYLYRYFLLPRLDRGLCLVFSALAVMILSVQTFDSLISDTDMTLLLATTTGTSNKLVSYMIFTVLILGAIGPIVYHATGSYVERCAKDSLEYNLRHLGHHLKAIGQRMLDPEGNSVRA